MSHNRLLNKKVKKVTVKDLKKFLKGADDDAEVILCFNWKNGDVRSGYLAEVFSHLKYDSVEKQKLDSIEVVELNCYDPEYCTYIERKQ